MLLSMEDDPETEILNRILAEELLESLSEEYRELLYLWLVEELDFREIGRILGLKYRGRVLTGSAMRYHRDLILGQLRALAGVD